MAYKLIYHPDIVEPPRTKIRGFLPVAEISFARIHSRVKTRGFLRRGLKYDFPKIPANIKESIRKAIEERLLFNPVIFGEPIRKSLKGHRKLRIGDYRVIYRINKNDIIILKIGHRKEVYSSKL